jgi:hypothetical protein
MDTKNKVQDKTKWKRVSKNKKKGDHCVAVFEKRKKKIEACRRMAKLEKKK